MPPKPKYSKEEIVQAAFELTRQKGISAVVAREVGACLGTSVSPIFTVFDSMDELKAEVYQLAKESFRLHMEGIFDYEPAFKEFGLRWIRFADAEPNLYRLLFWDASENSPYMHMQQDFSALLDNLIENIMTVFELSREHAEALLDRMFVVANGYASFAITDAGDFSEDQISRSISQICIGLVLVFQLQQDTFALPMATAMAKSCETATIPVKKET